ncbi:MAG TPA: beta-phosphoglucomutase family hydrolase [Aeromicrobium sp.]|nr:beta-phosphoglucomutase family hydrolase [Aeromicrobium sp.]
MDWNEFDAALYDLDGVLTPTALVHMRAWQEMFSGYLATHHPTQPPYTDEDYFLWVDGKPRYAGVRGFLESRGIDLPEGDPTDAPDALTVCGLGNRKNAVFESILATEGVAAYPGSRALVENLAGRGLKQAVVSSSRNAPDVLASADLIDHFETIVDGVVASERHLAGKPAPDTFLYAAELVDARPARCVVVEDALSGVQAARAGRFGLVIGVDRGVGADQLLEHGADMVVADLEELL